MKTAKEAREELEANETYQTINTRAKRRLEENINEAVARGDSRCYTGGSWRRMFLDYETDNEPINIQDEMIEYVRSLGYAITWNNKTAHPCVQYVCW